MGVLTEQMNQLCGDIVTLRKRRQALYAGLTQADTGRKAAVQELRAALIRSRLGMTRKSKQERLAFLDKVRRAAGGQRQALRADLAGARRAWAGNSA